MTTESFNENLSVSNDAHEEGERQVAFPGEAAALIQGLELQQLAQAETQQGAEALQAATATQPGVQTVATEENVVRRQPYRHRACRAARSNLRHR